MVKVNIDWQGKMKFTGTDEAGNSINMDAPVAAGGDGSAPTPLSLVLMAIAGCTGIDVLSILSKMKIKLDNFSMEVEGERADQHPKIFTNINVLYKFKGADLPRDKVERAVKLSVDKYCSVGHIVNKSAQINYAYEINGTMYQLGSGSSE